MRAFWRRWPLLPLEFVGVQVLAILAAHAYTEFLDSPGKCSEYRILEKLQLYLGVRVKVKIETGLTDPIFILFSRKGYNLMYDLCGPEIQAHSHLLRLYQLLKGTSVL